MKFSSVERRRWLIASLCGLVVAGLTLMLFRMPRSARLEVAAPTVKEGRKDAVGLARIDDHDATSRLRDEALLRDPTPLFLPTRWNVGENALPSNARQELGSAFQDYAAKLSFPVANLQLGFATPIVVPKQVPDVFDTDKPKRPFLGIGQTDYSVPPLPVRTAFVEVAAVTNGERVLAEPIAAAASPGEGNWQPLEFLVAVDQAGLVRPAMLVTSSQVSAVDAYFRNFLTEGLHIGERLAPGFYRVSIGP